MSRESAAGDAFDDLVAASPAMARVVETARRVSCAPASVLIRGETGVGKERLAAAIHARSERRQRPMIAVNCGAIPESLLESELFGHERGAFTGAERTHRGFFELADGGTLFLDEIGEMPQHLQVKLLRALQEREIRRVGGEGSIRVDVRILAATSRDLEGEIAAGRFRSDLYYRISVVTLLVPPLRDRAEDIPFLVQSFLQQYAVGNDARVSSVSPEAMQALCAYRWPGNVREVANAVERAVILCTRGEITVDDLPDVIAVAKMSAAVAELIDGAAGPLSQLDEAWFAMPLREARRAWNVAFERIYIERILREERGRVGRTAARMGVDPRSLYTKLRAYGLRKEDFRSGA